MPNRHSDEDFSIFPREPSGQDILALAQRIANMADAIGELSGDVRVMTERGANRDESIKELRQEVAEMGNELGDFNKRQINQLTDAELKVLRTIMLGKDRSEWLRDRSKYYILGTIVTATTIWAARDWIRALLVWLRILPS